MPKLSQIGCIEKSLTPLTTLTSINLALWRLWLVSVLRKRLCLFVNNLTSFAVAEDFSVPIIAPVDKTKNLIPSSSGPEIAGTLSHLAHDLTAPVAVQGAGLQVDLSCDRHD